MQGVLDVFLCVAYTNLCTVSFAACITVQLVWLCTAFVQPFLTVQAPSQGGTFIIKEEKYFSMRLHLKQPTGVALGLNELVLINTRRGLKYYKPPAQGG